MDLWHVASRVLFGYFFALVLIRASGRRTVGRNELPSFIVLLIIGDMFDNLFWSEISIGQFAVAAGTIALTHFLARGAAWRAGVPSPPAEAPAESRP